MQAYQVFPNLLVRTPLYSFASSFYECSALQDETFRCALFFASRSFYRELQKKEFDWTQLNQKQKQTVRKYLNRAVFRSTPFGLFSSVALAAFEQGSENATVELGPIRASISPDYAVLHSLWEQSIKDDQMAEVKYRTNETLWYTGTDLRFVKKELQSGKAVFSVVSVDTSTAARSLFSLCRTERSVSEIMSFLLKRTGAGPGEALAFVSELVSVQALIAATSPNITGPDYSERVLRTLPVNQATDALKSGLSQFSRHMSATALDMLSDRLDKYLPQQGSRSHYYCLAERESIRGGLPVNYQEAILQGVHCLNVLSKPVYASQLETFKKAFVARYDTVEVPLLEALDGQYGVGYGGMEDLKINYGFSSDHRSSQQLPYSSAKSENSFVNQLLGEWLHGACSSRLPQVEIRDEHLAQLGVAEKKKECAPSISVMFRPVGDQVFIESAGGASALSLMGRFGFSDAIYSYGSQIAQVEQQNNPDVVFAEIAHACDLHTANVNRRPSYYDYEIPVLTTSVLPQEQQIALSDLLVSVRNDAVVVRSGKLRKRVIPRLSSAFNYQRSSLPIFRFLCDLQYEGLRPALNFSMSAMFPGLSFYPRLVYKSCILQLAEWHLDGKQLEALCAASPDERFAEFQKLCTAQSIPRFFSWGSGDNYLVFDSTARQDVIFFISEVAGKERVVVREFPFMDSRPTVMDDKHQPLLGQYVSALVYEGSSYPADQSGEGEYPDPRVPSGNNDWLYFKIYCHPLNSDNILGHLFPKIKKLLRSHSVERWFWIRYMDPDYHLRLRLKIATGKRAAVLMVLTSILDKLCRKKMVRQFQVDTYRPELRRYSPALMEQVEAVFKASSELVAERILQDTDNHYEDQTTLVEAVQSTCFLLRQFGFAEREQATFSHQQFEGFFREFGSSHLLKNDLEKLYRGLSQLVVCSGEIAGSNTYKKFADSIEALRSEHAARAVEFPGLFKLAADLIHMHLNRLFVYDQRYFEMITYFLVYRTLNTRMHRRVNDRSAASGPGVLS